MTTIQMTQAAVAATVSANFIITKEQFLTVKSTWANTTEHSAADIVTYNLLRGFDPKRGFTAISPHNTYKISSNSNDPWFGFNNAKNLAYGNVMVVTNKWRSAEDNEALTKYHLDRFKEKFGIDLTDEIRLAIKSVGTYHG